jgi:hypothetical protein
MDPYLVRIGPNFSEALQNISFDYLVNQETRSGLDDA